MTDDGAAPNPFWGICTLTICKPSIRRVAEVGDWVIAIGSKNVYGNNYYGMLVYAMQITEVLSLKDYDAFCRKELSQKIPNIKSKDYRRRVGDCIYDYSENKRAQLRPSVHYASSKKRDLGGKNALLSDYFFYFGDQAVPIPEKFSVLVRNGQGHQSYKNDVIKHAFVGWLTTSFRPNKLYGSPQVYVDFDEEGKQIKTCGRECEPKRQSLKLTC